jgi:hypothetical protein
LAEPVPFSKYNRRSANNTITIMKSSSNHLTTASSVAAKQGQSVDGHYEIEVARQRLAASLRVLDAAVNVADNARKMMEFSSTNVIATNITTIAGAQQGNKELEAAIKIDDTARRMIDFATTNVATAQYDVQMAKMALRDAERRMYNKNPELGTSPTSGSGQLDQDLDNMSSMSSQSEHRHGPLMPLISRSSSNSLTNAVADLNVHEI